MHSKKSFDEYYQYYVTEQRSKEQHQNEAKALIQSIFDKFSDINSIVIIGSTPSWNDGDLCFHSQELMINNFCENAYNFSINKEHLNEIGLTFVDEDEDEDFLWANTKYGVNKNIQWPETVVNASKLLNATSNLFEAGWQTNFMLTFVRADNSFKFSENDFYCED